jgi:hypothetical protein
MDFSHGVYYWLIKHWKRKKLAEALEVLILENVSKAHSLFWFGYRSFREWIEISILEVKLG